MSENKFLFKWGEFEHFSEEDYFNYLEKELPSGYYVIHSKYLKTRNIHYEVDFIVICPKHIYLVEQKCWGDKIVGNDSTWEIYHKNNPKPTYRKSPYRTTQTKQRVLDEIIGKICREKGLQKPYVTSIIVLGNPEKQDIDFELSGNCMDITHTPKDSVKLFLKHKRFSNKIEEQKEKEKSKKIFIELKRDLEDLKKIEVNRIYISNKEKWSLILVNENGKINLVESSGELSNTQIQIELDSPTPKTEYYYEAINCLKESLISFLSISLIKQTDYSKGVENICQSWLETLSKGKILPSIIEIPILKLNTSEDIFYFLAGGYIRVDVDYSESFSKFRYRMLTPKSKRDRFIVINGEVGSGKTTQLCRIAYDFLLEEKEVYLLNPEIPFTENLKIKDSIIIVDNFERLHPAVIQKLALSSLNGRNIVYGALKSELKELIVDKYSNFTSGAKIPWRNVSLPKWNYQLQYEVFTKLQNDWKCYVVKESIPSILQYSLGNPILLSEPLKFPERTMGSPSMMESMMKFFTGYIGLPAIYTKKLRLITELADLTDISYDKIVKTIYLYINNGDFFPEFIWDFWSKNMDLLPLNHPIMRALIPRSYNDRYQYFQLWKYFFQMCNRTTKQMFSTLPHAGESEKFEKYFEAFEPEKWEEEFQKFKREIKFGRLIQLNEMDIYEKIIFAIYGYIDEEVIWKIQNDKILIEIAKQNKKINKMAGKQLLICFLLSILLMKSDKPKKLKEKLEFLFEIIDLDNSFESLSLFTLSLRNYIEVCSKNNFEINPEVEVIFQRLKPNLTDAIEKGIYLERNYESFPVEVYRICLYLDDKYGEKIKKLTRKDTIFGTYIQGLIDYYWIRKNEKNLKSEVFLRKSCDILYNWLWDIKHTDEEFDLFNLIVSNFQSEKEMLSSITLGLAALDLAFKISPLNTLPLLENIEKLTKEYGSKSLYNTIRRLNSIIYLFQPQFLFRNIDNFDDLYKTYQSIIHYLL
ncbi:MAG: NERD domain-containing protein, partial [Candidatus Heimdallarchaeaceae archaeon]